MRKISFVFIILLFSLPAYAARTITSVTVDGSSSTTVSAGGSVSVQVNVTTSGGGSSNDWESTEYTIDSTTVCVDHGDHKTSGSYSETFNITAPTSSGNYDLTVVAYQHDSCNGGSDSDTLLNAVTVSGGATCVTFRDEFSSVSYANNDGSANWLSNWDEVGDADSASNGEIVVQNNELRLTGGDNSSPTASPPSSGFYIQRAVDLSAYTSATLSFRYRDNGNWEPSDEVRVYISGDGGSSWSMLQAYANDVNSWVNFSQDISSYIGADTRIAFANFANSNGESALFDNIEIEACGSSGGGSPTLAADFNCVHSASADSANGRLYTRVVGGAFNFDVAALDSSGSVESAFADIADRDVTVQLVDMSSGGACGSLPVLNPAVSQVMTFSASDAGEKTSASMTVNRAYRSVGCRVTDANDSPTVQGCSSDSFAIRPASLSLSTPALNNAGAIGAPVAIAGDPAGFTLQVTTVTGYDGTPVIAGALEAHSGGVAGSLTGTFPAADINTGTTTGTSFVYDEVGNFRFPVEAIRDTSFTSVDQTSDCVDNSYSNTVNGNGKVGCDFANSTATDWVGRFRPDHFALSVVNGSLDNTCVAGGFSYAGTAIPFLVDASLTITAENALTPPTTTQNYTGNYAKLYLAGLSMTESETAQNVSLSWNVDFDSPTVQTDTGNSNKLIFTAGQTTLSLAGDSFTLGRAASEILAPFAPAIEITVNAVQEDGALGDGVVAQDENGAADGKIQIQPGASAVMSRYGRLNIVSASGTEQQDLNVPVQVEYYDGTNFIANTDDSCTTQVEVELNPHSGEIQPGDSCFSPACSAAASYILPNAGNGDFSHALQAPSGGKTGVLKVDALNVPAHLLYDWLGTGAQNPPSATASFGNYHWENQMIYMREVR